MDELNNLNPNGANNNPYQPSNVPNPNASPYQANNNQNSDVNSYETSNDPYSSLNPDYISNTESPYDSMNSNPYQPINKNDMNPDFPQQDNNDYSPSNNQPVLNPILSQSIPNNNNNAEPINTDNQNDSFDVSSLDNQDNNTNNMDYQYNNYDNMNPQENNFDNSFNNMNYQNNGFDSSNNMNYQDNSFNNMNYQNNGFDNSNNMNYQPENFDNPDVTSNFSDPNLNYQDNNYNNQNFVNNESNDDYNTEFIKRWMGNLYEKAHSKKFNWCSALFGPAYFLYRKMYVTGFLLVILSFLIAILSTFLVTKLGVVSFAIAGAISILLMIIYGVAFYPLYRNFVKGKLNKFKQTITDNSQLLNEATKKGNTSVIAVILYFIISPILLSLIISLFISAGIIDIKNAFTPDVPLKNETENQEVETDLQPFNFVDDYTVTYDALKWFYDDTDNSLNKGGYILTYTGQSLSNVSESFGVDVTTPSGRSSLLQTLASSYETQAASSNLTVDLGSSNFVRQTNAYYAYLDVTSPDSVERYYLILIPEDDIIFQFVLTTADTAVDFETNLEVVNILTSIESALPSDEDIPTDENVIDDESDENIIDNETSNSTDLNSVDDEDTENAIGNDIANVTDDVSNSVSTTDENATSDEDTATENTSGSNNNVTPLSDILS